MDGRGAEIGLSSSDGFGERRNLCSAEGRGDPLDLCSREGRGDGQCRSILGLGERPGEGESANPLLSGGVDGRTLLCMWGCSHSNTATSVSSTSFLSRERILPRGKEYFA